ncbi:MAG: N-acetylmuramoyl-L-alanine amidase, partial [Clostridium sp.]
MLKKTIMETVAGMLLVTGLFMITRYVGLTVSTQSVHIGKDKPVVMLDAGHGGNDPGKVGVDGSLEKDINIAITLKLKEYLEQSDVTVILTRENKGGLYKEKDSHKKMA